MKEDIIYVRRVSYESFDRRLRALAMKSVHFSITCLLIAQGQALRP